MKISESRNTLNAALQSARAPPNHRLAFFVQDLCGSDLLQSCLFELLHEDFKAFGALSQVKLHITLI